MVPSTGPISLETIRAEFGGSTPIQISTYYGAAPGVPTSGAISIGSFRGMSKP